MGSHVAEEHVLKSIHLCLRKDHVSDFLHPGVQAHLAQGHKVAAFAQGDNDEAVLMIAHGR